MPEGDFTKLGNAMRNARKSRGFTQERLSDVSGVSVRHIAKIEKGVINPSFDILEKLITALGTSFDAFYNPATEKDASELQEIVCLYVVVKKSRHEKYLFLICFFKSRQEKHFCGSCFFKSGHGQ